MAEEEKTGEEQEREQEQERKTDDDKPAAQLERLRREAAEERRKRKDAEGERDRLKDAALSDQEKATKRAEEAESRSKAATEKVRAVSLKAEVGLTAPGLGIVNPKAALRLIDSDDIEYDEDGDADTASVTKALKAAIKEYPFLTRTGSADAGDGGENGDSRKGAGEDRFSKDLNAALRRSRR